MKLNIWFYVVIFLLISFGILVAFQLIFYKTAELTSLLVFLPAYIIVDIIYYKIEKKEFSITKSINRLSSIITVILGSGLIIIPYYLIISIIKSRWENIIWLLLMYLVGTIFVCLSLVFSSFVNKTKFSDEIKNIFRHFE